MTITRSSLGDAFDHMDRSAPLGFNPWLSIYITVTSSSDLRLSYLALYHEL